MTEAALRYVIDVQDRSLKEAKKELRDLNKVLGQEVDDASSKGSAAFGKIGGAAVTGAKVAGGAILGLGGLALKAAGDYEQSLNVFAAVSGATGKQMEEVGRLAKQLGADVKLPGTSARDAAEAMTELAKGGLNVKDSMKAVRGVLQLSAAAGIGNAEAATIAARALNSFGLSGKEATRVADLLAATANASTAEITDVAMGMQQASATAKQLGVPIEDLTTAIGLMANAGVAGSDAGTSLKTLMARLVPSTNKAAEAMHGLGLMTKDGKNKFFDAQGEFVGFRKATELVTAATKGMSQEQRLAAFNTIFGSDAVRAANIVLGDGTKKFDDMKGAVTKQGAAADLAAAKNKGFKGTLDAFKSTLETLAISFGQVLLPAATKAMGFLSSAFGKLEEHKTLTLVVVGVLAGLAGAVLAVNAALKVYRAGMVVVTAAQWVLNAAMAANPMFLVIAALIALGAALVVAYKKSETFREIVDGAFRAVHRVVDGFVDFFTDTVPAAFRSVLDWLRSRWPEIAMIISGPFAPLVALATDSFGVRTAIVNAFTAIASWVEQKVSDIARFVTGLPGRVADFGGELASRVGGFFASAGTTIADDVSRRVGNWASFITAIPSRVADFAENLAGRVIGFLGTAGTKIATNVSERVGNWAEFVTKLPGRVADFAEGLAARVIGFLGTAGSSIAADVSRRVGNWADFVTDLPGRIASFAADLAKRVIGFFQGAAEGAGGIVASLKEKVGNWADLIGDLPGRAGKAITGKVGELKDAITGIFSKLPGWVKDILGIKSPSQVFTEIGHDIVRGLIRGLERMAPALRDKAVALAKSLPGALLGGGAEPTNTRAFMESYAARMGWTVSSGYREGDPGFHGQNRAVDLVGPNMAAIFHNIVDTFGVGNIKELFFDPIGWYVDNGTVHQGAIGDHMDHVHWAMARGGIVPGWMLGDRGAAAHRREAVVPLETRTGIGALAAALEEALARLQRGRPAFAGGPLAGAGGGPLFTIGEQHIHNELDAELSASAIGRKLAVLK